MNIYIIVSSVYIQPEHFNLDAGNMWSLIFQQQQTSLDKTKQNISGGIKNL